METMKALTLTQPWATLVAIGAKRIETRSWSTKYRGPLAIHAAKGFPKEARAFTTYPVCYDAVAARFSHREQWEKRGFPAYPLGAVLATCTLVNVLQVEVVNGRDNTWGISIAPISENELAFGDYSPGRYAWLLEDIKIIEPLAAKGALGLWEWEPAKCLSGMTTTNPAGESQYSGRSTAGYATPVSIVPVPPISQPAAPGDYIKRAEPARDALNFRNGIRILIGDDPNKKGPCF